MRSTDSFQPLSSTQSHQILRFSNTAHKTSAKTSRLQNGGSSSNHKETVFTPYH